MKIGSTMLMKTVPMNAAMKNSIVIGDGRGVYLYVLEGAPVTVNGHDVPVLGAAMATKEKELSVRASGDAELLLIDVLMI